MPIYEYECCVCDHHFEEKQSFDEEPVAVCPHCRGKSRRVLQSVPIIFKGSGFYVTDNPRSGFESSTASTPKSKPNKEAKKD